MTIPEAPLEKMLLEKNSFALKVNYLAEHGVVKLTASGEFTLGSNEQLVATALAAGKLHGAHLFLLDAQNMNLGLNLVELYDLPENNRQRGVPGHFRLALLYTPSNADNSRLFKFFEDRAVIADLKRRIFVDSHTAIDWLLH